MSTIIETKNKTYNVAVVGATGAVGQEMIRMLESRNFPIKNLRLLASERSKNKKLSFRGSPVNVEVLHPESISDLDIAIFSAGGTISKEYAPLFAKQGTFVIDNSSAWRMEPGVPLVVPEVNPQALAKDKKIIANPNCSTIQMVVALKPIHDAVGINTIRVSTYQSVSGAGYRGIQDLEEQTRAWAQGKPIPEPKKISHQIAFNLVPQIDVFDEDDYTKEELKMVYETRKIMESPSMKISATCVRVPVFRSHSEVVWVETDKAIDVPAVRALLKTAPGVELVDEPARGVYPMPIHAEGKSITYVGRIRKDLASPNGLVLWIVSDNLLKGAALNAVEIAEALVKKGLV